MFTEPPSDFIAASAGTTLADVETPCPVVDVDIAERNLRRLQVWLGRYGIANRPHIKTHKLVYWARRQLAEGACGITCQTLGEAEPMADAGIGDIFISYPILGARKLARLMAIAARATVSVAVDSLDAVAGLREAAARAGVSLGVVVECDTGTGRCGVQTPQAAAALARAIADSPPLRFLGLMAYPKAGGRLATAAFLARAKALCEADGHRVAVVSSGGTPDWALDEGLSGLTEYRAGTYLYNDRSLVARGTCGFADCALTVLATVISRPTAMRAIIDAGSKALSSDLLGLDGYGYISEYPDAMIPQLNEEHGYVQLAAPSPHPAIGEVVRVVPNHACVVTNLFDRVVFIRGDTVLGSMRVDARGRG